MTAPDDRLRDGRHLIRRFSLAKHYFRKPLAQGPVMIDARESKVFEWCLAYELKQSSVRISQVERSLLDSLQKREEVVGGHLRGGGNWLAETAELPV